MEKHQLQTISLRRHRQDWLVDGVVEPIETEDGIYGFFGKYRDLSNFGKGTVTIDGMRFLCSEGAYMAQKTHDVKHKQALTLMLGKEAKAYGQTVPLREDWNDVRVNAMYRVLLAKFSQNRDLRDLLLSTGNKYLEETNWWNDKFWGVCGGEGENNLGKTLMRVRDVLRRHEEAEFEFLGQ